WRHRLSARRHSRIDAASGPRRSHAEGNSSHRQRAGWLRQWPMRCGVVVRGANQARHRVSVARKSIQRSPMGRARNLAALFIVVGNGRWLEFEQATFIELAEQDQQIAMAA